VTGAAIGRTYPKTPTAAVDEQREYSDHEPGSGEIFARPLTAAAKW
jgi:hypothetical protein